MKRRDFLKRAVVVVAGATVIPAVVKAKPSCSVSVNPSVESNWNNLGCKDCFVGCVQFDICKAELRRRVAKASEGRIFRYWEVSDPKLHNQVNT